MSTIDVRASSSPQPLHISAAPTAARFGHRTHPLLRASARHLLTAAICFPMVLPFLWMLLTSVKPLSEVGLPDWIPHRWQWHNYAAVFDPAQGGVPFVRFYWNSVIVALWVTFLQLITSAMAAFSFARINWPGRERVFFLYLATLMVPGVVLMIPNYQLMIKLHLVDSLTGLILPCSFGAFGTFLLRQFMLGIPVSLDEAAEIDGAGKWWIFWEIILPLSRPGLITLAIFTFIGNYQSFFWPLVILRTVDKYTLPVGLLYFDSTLGQTTHLLMAAVTMSVVPLVILFVVLQKYLVSGIQLGAVKG